MKDLGSWKHLFRKRDLDAAEYDKPATRRDIALVSDQTLRRILVLVGLMLLVSGALYWDQGRKQHESDVAISAAQLANATAQRAASISGCKRQNQLRAVSRDNLKAEHVANRATRKLFKPEQFGLSEHQYKTLIKQADQRYRHALHRLAGVDCAAKYPPPRPASLAGD